MYPFPTHSIRSYQHYHFSKNSSAKFHRENEKEKDNADEPSKEGTPMPRNMDNDLTVRPAPVSDTPAKEKPVEGEVKFRRDYGVWY